jgi:hypothetical protein
MLEAVERTAVIPDLHGLRGILVSPPRASHFMAPGKRDLTTEAGLEAAVSELDQEYERSAEFAQLAASLSVAVLVARIRAMPERDEKLDLLMQQVIERMPMGVEIIHQGNPASTLWRTTRIVRLLKRAEQETEPFEGLTLLQRAGQFIRANDPDLSYRDYGLEKLSHIVAASGLFEMFEVASADGAIKHIGYRTK